MANAGEVELGVTPDLSSFSNLLSSGVLKSLGPVEGLIKSHLGVALGAGVAVALGALAKVSIDAFEEREKVLISLENTLSSMPALAGQTSKAFQDQAAALQDLTGVEDETILSVDTLLARFDLTGDQIRKLTPLVLDYAAKTGTDATSAAQKLGLSLLGNARALKSMGITFTATGDRVKDFNTIVKLLEPRIGGLAEEMGQTLSGQMNILKANVNDLEEEIGAVLVPILLTVAKVLNAVLGPALNFVAENLKIVIALFIAFAVALKIESIIRGVTIAVTALGGALVKLGIEKAGAGVLSFAESLAGVGAAAAGMAVPIAIGVAAVAALTIGIIHGMHVNDAYVESLHQVALAQVKKSGTINAETTKELLNAGVLTKYLHEQGDLYAPGGALLVGPELAKRNQEQLNLAKEHYIRDLKEEQDLAAHVLEATTASQSEFNAKLKDTVGLQQQLADATQQSVLDVSKAVQQGISDVNKAYDAAVKKSHSVEGGIKAMNESIASWFHGQMDAAKGFLADWQANAAASLNFVTGKVGEFLNKTNVNINSVISAEKDALAQQKTFGSNLNTILDKGGKQAKEFVNWAIQQGPAAFGLVKSVAEAGSKKMGEFIGTWNKAQGNAESLAVSLERRVVGTLKQIRDILETIVEKTWGVTINAEGNAVPTVNTLTQNLELVSEKPWIANLTLHTHGGSTAFDLLKELTKELLKVTEEKWTADLTLLINGGQAGSEKLVASWTKMFDKMKTVADDFVSAVKEAVGEKLPESFLKQAKSFQQMVNEQSKHLTRLANQAQKSFDAIIAKAKDFRDAIESGFGSASDLIGGALSGLTAKIEEGMPQFNIQQFLAEQLAANAGLAGGLAQLAAQGLAPALLSELANQGTSALPLIQALLQGGQGLIDQFNSTQEQIDQFAKDTGELLTGEQFGGQIKKAGQQLSKLADRIDNFNDRVRAQAANFIDSLQAPRLADVVGNLITQLNHAMDRLGKGGAGISAAGGYHGTLSRDTMIQAHAGERVDIGPGGAQLAAVGTGDTNVYVDVRGNAVYSRDLADEIRSVLLKDKRHKGALGLS